MCEPGFTYFKPAGVGVADLEETVLTVDEYEAVRLKDFEGMEQSKAAAKMGISQPTFHRLLLCARKKISEAIVNGKAIKIQGGDYKMARPGRGLGRGTGRGAGQGAGLGRGTGPGGRMGGVGAGPGGRCVCPECGYEETQVRGHPCMDKKCPECGARMMRK